MSAKRILVVDDDPMVQESISYMLEPDGYVLEMAPSGPAALERYEKARYDLLLTDNRMPGMSGLELGREIRKRDSQQRIILFSGSPPMGPCPECNLVILKPFSAGDLRKAVRTVLDGGRADAANSAAPAGA